MGLESSSETICISSPEKDLAELRKKLENAGSKEEVDKYGKEAFFANTTIQYINFPWFDHLGLCDNLHKTLTLEQMQKYKSRAERLHDVRQYGFPVIDNVIKDTLERLA
ncbi:MAG TPA: hypothetical protein ENI70_00510 [Candidatus Peregrinibacteria bacterium]|nr:hypothetical protein [Candidatus Peregrinibacteria bacterium]